MAGEPDFTKRWEYDLKIVFLTFFWPFFGFFRVFFGSGPEIRGLRDQSGGPKSGFSRSGGPGIRNPGVPDQENRGPEVPNQGFRVRDRGPEVPNRGFSGPEPGILDYDGGDPWF